MAHITEEHLHHMAKRHHATMQKLNGLTETLRGYAQKGFGLLGTGAGAFAGGLFEGRTNGSALAGVVPYNLLGGVAFLVASNFIDNDMYSKHLENFGNGLVASYTSAIGYKFGKRWAETGQAFGGGGSPWLHPYENGWPKPGAVPSNGAAAAPVAPPPMPPAAAGW